jgi:hypothetical protein
MSQTLPYPLDFAGVRVNLRVRSPEDTMIRVSAPQIGKILRAGAVMVRCTGSYSDDYSYDSEYGYFQTRFRPVRHDILRGETRGATEDVERCYHGARRSYYDVRRGRIHVSLGINTGYEIAPADSLAPAEVASLAEQRAGPTQARHERHQRLRPRLAQLLAGKPRHTFGALQMGYLFLPPAGTGRMELRASQPEIGLTQILLVELPPEAEIDEDSLTVAIRDAKVLREDCQEIDPDDAPFDDGDLGDALDDDTDDPDTLQLGDSAND